MEWTTLIYLCVAWLTGFWVGGLYQFNRGVQYGSQRTMDMILENYHVKPKETGGGTQV